ncbi:MAG: TolB-like 6-bladed beta-propeller domain-containing protein [Bacteroidales bacterium]|nr:TolB-like 6-bladed beta-propeller domain-containing protein [Bacteroidales bacterium]MCF8337068.1 TolB-like 6-bladed beta-propeller domain-containing protein [Bacteroidales bacterium]
MKIKILKNIPIIIFIVLISNLHISCTKNNEEKSPLKAFRDSTLIQGNQLKISSEHIGEATYSLLIDSILVIKDTKNTDYAFHLININKKKYTKSFGKKGNGPKELAHPMGLNKNIQSENINTYASTKNKIFTYNVDSLLQKNDYKPYYIKKFMGEFLMPVQIQNGLFITTGPFEKGRYRLTESAQNLNKFIFDYPVDSEHEEAPNESKSMVYQGRFKLQPEGKRFAFATNRAGILEIFQANNGTISKVIDQHFYNPDYKVQSKYSVPIYPNNKMGFTDMSATKDYLYVLYSGRTILKYRKKFLYGKHVLVFNWQGTPIKHYKLDKAVRCISVNKTNSLLYAWAALPEPALLEYAFNH